MTNKTKKQNALGFPPPLLGEQPLRLAILAEAEGWLALEKPAGVGTRAYPWDATPDLDAALNVQLEAGKPELLRTGASLFGSVYYLDPEMTGPALFAKNREVLADMRNRFGSGECRFVFHFMSASNHDADAAFEADAPLLAHRVKPKMIPSTAKGKKSRTQFKQLQESESGWALWEARADFFRPHQVRAHAATHGIPVLGDALYGGPDVPTLRQLQPRVRRSDSDVPVFQGVAIHLSSVEIQAENREIVIKSPTPKALALLLKRAALKK